MRPHDAAWKLLFSFPEMVRDLLAGFVPREWTGDLDLSTLGRGPGSHVSDELSERHQDRVWRVPFRDQRRDALVLLEFQSTVDRTMAVRMLAYTALLHQDLMRVAPSEALPPVLPIVLYHGRERWSAPEEVAGLTAPHGGHLAPYQPAQRYCLLDLGRYTDPLPPVGRNRVAELVRIARSRGPKESAVAFAALAEWLSEPEHDALMRAFWQWLGRVHLPAHHVDVVLPPLKNWREAVTKMDDVLEDWRVPIEEQARAKGEAEGRAKGEAEGRAKGEAQGRAEGRMQGQADAMRWLAARKFDAVTAERLAGRLAEIADPERMEEIGEWLIECDDGAELLERVERLCAAGDGAPHR